MTTTREAIEQAYDAGFQAGEQVTDTSNLGRVAARREREVTRLLDMVSDQEVAPHKIRPFARDDEGEGEDEPPKIRPF